MEVSSNTIRESIVNCLTQQISEYELLQSMYPNQGELILSEKNIIDNINQFIDGKIHFIPNHLDFKLNLLEGGLKLELFINLPSAYPQEEPEIYVRCNKLNRHNESKLNADLCKYITENHFQDVCLYTGIAWLQENIENYTTIQQTPVKKNPSTSEIKVKEEKYTRLWIYSHHIYNKRKREDIVKRARDLKLTGFCLPGKPGIICIEGPLDDCDDWWKDIKSMSWKKIMIRKTESFEPGEKNTYKKFSNFEELYFKEQAHRHAKMSELSKFMTELGFNQIFHDIFKLCTDD